MQDTIRISASKVAAACGMNPYCEVQEVLRDVLKKHFPHVEIEPEQKQVLLERCDEVSIRAFVKSSQDILKLAGKKLEIADEIACKPAAVEKCIEAMGQKFSASETQTDCDNREKKIVNVIESGITDPTLAGLLKKDLASHVATSRGAARESQDLDNFEKERKMSVSDRNAKFYSKVWVGADEDKDHRKGRWVRRARSSGRDQASQAKTFQ